MPGQQTLSELAGLFADGGPVMFILAFIAVVLYSTATAALFFVSKSDLTTKRQNLWANWIKQPISAEGRDGEIIRYALHGSRISTATVERRFDEIREVVLNSIDRRLIIIGSLIAVAPMAGLLGTVGGMLDMFDGLANASGKKSMDKIQSGMMESLLSPLTGLVIALPGMFLALHIRQKRNWIAAALMQLESAILTTRFKEVQS